MKKVKEYKVLILVLVKGDEIVIGGGLVGKIVKVGDSYVIVEIVEGVEVVVQKLVIGIVLLKGMLKLL